ncbi:MAG TPA: GAF domain-containing protein [Bacteroidaceae bacterium]|nr:GAF domain-containing protein [Bacteroidaceae bacterium]
MKQLLSSSLKTVLPCFIMAFLFLIIFLGEFRTGHALVVFFSAAGILVSIILAIISVAWFKGTFNSVYRALKELNRGRLPEIRSLKNWNSKGELEQELEKHIRNQREIIDFARAMEDGNFSEKLTMLGEEDPLRSSLFSLGKKLELSRKESEKRREEDEYRTWTANGMARFGSLLRETEDNLEKMASSLLSELVNYTVADLGGVFIVADEKGKEEKLLHLIGSYAFDRQKYITRQFRFGEGLVGRAAMEKDIIYITEVPENYIKIRSGLGEDRPASLLLSPAILNNEVLAVLELASFESFPVYQVEFIKLLSGTIAITLSRMHLDLTSKALPRQSGKEDHDLSED